MSDKNFIVKNGIDATGTVTATSFVGDGSGLTNLPVSSAVSPTSSTTLSYPRYIALARYTNFDYSTFYNVSSTDGTTWVASTMPFAQGNTEHFMINGSIFLASSYGTSILTSTNGVSWTVGTRSKTSWQSAAYGVGKFVGLESNGTQVEYSTDGVTWSLGNTLPTPASGNQYQKMVFAGDKFFLNIYASSQSQYAYSTDAITWTMSTFATADRYYYVAYGNNKYVTVSVKGTSVAQYSTDGITWSAATLPASSCSNFVTYGNGKFLTVYTSGTTRAASSTDGITWSSATVPSSGASWTGLQFINGKFYLISSGSDYYSIYSSTDAVTWVNNFASTSIGGSSNTPVMIAYDSELNSSISSAELAFLKGTNKNIQTSLDLKAPLASPTFTGTVTIPNSSIVNADTLNATSIKYSLPSWFAVANGPSVAAAASTDGITWSKRTLPVSKVWSGIASNDKVIVTVATDNAGIIYYSYDSVNWNQVTLTTSFPMQDVVYGNGKFVAGGNSQQVVTSTDGINWTYVQLPAYASSRKINYLNGKFVLISSTTSIISSTDAITWTLGTLPKSAQWYDSTYGAGKYVVISNSSSETQSTYSTDLITWTLTAMPMAENWQNVDYNGTVFLATAGYNQSTNSATSTDGVTWTSATIPLDPYFGSALNWTALTVSDSKFYMVAGANGFSGFSATSTNGTSWTVSNNMPSWDRWANLVKLNLTSGAVFSSGAASTLNTFPNITSNLSVTVPTVIISANNSTTSGTSYSYISTDGISWTKVSNNSSLGNYNLIGGKNGFVGWNNNGDSTYVSYSSDGLKWTNTTLSTTAYLYERGVYGHLGYSALYSSVIFVSSDGINWTHKSLSGNTFLTWTPSTMTYGQGKYLVASGNQYAVSTDLSYWQVATTASYVDDLSAAGNRFFSTYSYYSTIKVSTDGLSWTAATLPLIDNVSSPIYANSKYYFFDTGGSTSIYYSTDAVTWSVTTSPVALNAYKVMYGANKFIIYPSHSSGGTTSYYSTDAVTWTLSTFPESPSTTIYGTAYAELTKLISPTALGSIANSKGDFQKQIDNLPTMSYVAPINNSTLTGVTKATSITTTNQSVYSSVQTQNLNLGTALYVKYPAGQNMPYAGMISSDAVTWTTVTLPLSKYFQGMAYGAGKFVTVDQSSTAVMYSTDAITWSISTIGTSFNYPIAYANGLFFVPTYSTTMNISTDAITWTKTTMPVSAGWTSVAYGNGVYAAGSGSTSFASSTDGITWTLRTGVAITSGGLMQYFPSNGKFVGYQGVNGGRFTTSTDAITWTALSFPGTGWNSNGSILSIVYGNGKYVASPTGYDYRYVAYSTDMVTWANSTMPTGTSGELSGGLVFANGQFYLSQGNANAGYIYNYYSTDAVTWTYRLISSSSPSNALKNFYASNASQILTSPSNLNKYIYEDVTVSATAATGTVNYDLITNGGVAYYTANSSNNWTLNVRGNSSTTLNTLMNVGQSLTITFLVTNTSPAYYPTAFQVDGTAVTVKWLGGTAPSAGSTNAVDAYSYTILKTARSTYTVFGSASKFA
jgi:hypothetical protein